MRVGQRGRKSRLLGLSSGERAPEQHRATFRSGWRPCCSPPPLRTTASPRRNSFELFHFSRTEELAGELAHLRIRGALMIVQLTCSL
ncbi:uncharacterized protein LOC143177880 isoform X2 [Calliopsis andreniformis]|uniref:uncharacterized protein LOC143177880 isoform X2 n=1 Tax=Calliopsis andreniformis TaxID=337506 RepID=UPI003FCCB26C